MKRKAWFVNAAGLAVCASLVLPTSSLAVTSTRPSLVPRVSISVDRSTQGAAVVATAAVTRLDRTTPVRVYWGDGTRSRVASSCLTTQARRHPNRCASAARHAYGAPGTFTITITTPRTHQVLATRTFAVPASDLAPGPSPSPVPSPTPTAPSQSPAADPSPWVTEMLARVNTLRASVGAGPMHLCASLSTAAQKHSDDMATRDYFSHYSPEGTGPGERIGAEGYHGGGWGENIAAGYSDVAEVMAGWIASPGHYANLVNTSYTDVGFGRATQESSKYGSYWTQDFGSGAC